MEGFSRRVSSWGPVVQTPPRAQAGFPLIVTEHFGGGPGTDGWIP